MIKVDKINDKMSRISSTTGQKIYHKVFGIHSEFELSNDRLNVKEFKEI